MNQAMADATGEAERSVGIKLDAKIKSQIQKIMVKYSKQVDGTKSCQVPVQVRGRHIAVFCSGLPYLDTVITIL